MDGNQGVRRIPRGPGVASDPSTERAPEDLSEDAGRLARGSRILVITDDGRSPAYARARGSAIDLAHAIDGSLLFYDRTTESRFVDPYPSGPLTSDNDGPKGDRTLGPGDVHALGRDYLGDAIKEAASSGVRARAWLPRRVGSRGIAEAVTRFGCDLVVAPSELGRSAILERRWFGAPRPAISVPFLLAGPDGSIRDWQFAPEASRIEFEVRQFGIIPVRGSFSGFDVALAFDEERPEATVVRASIDAGSVETGIGLRDRALRGRSFFDAERYPRIIFESHRVSRSGPRIAVAGDLEIKGRRREVELVGEFHGVVDAKGHRRATMRLSTEVDRHAWSLEGGLAIGDRARITIDAVAVRATDPSTVDTADRSSEGTGSGDGHG